VDRIAHRGPPAIRRWLDTRFYQWSAFACAVADRNLSEQEWQAVFGDQPYRETCQTG
jgi:hypothetical protein